MRRVRFRYAANTLMRDALAWWAYTSIRTSPWARAAYDEGKARRPTSSPGFTRACRPLGPGAVALLARLQYIRRGAAPSLHLAPFFQLSIAEVRRTSALACPSLGFTAARFIGRT